LPELKIAHAIGKAVWDQVSDIPDVISIDRLVRKEGRRFFIFQME
jgi:hypothetical protein